MTRIHFMLFLLIRNIIFIQLDDNKITSSLLSFLGAFSLVLSFARSGLRWSGRCIRCRVVHEYAALLVVRGPDYKAYPCLLFYGENSFLRDGELLPFNKYYILYLKPSFLYMTRAMANCFMSSEWYCVTRSAFP